MTARRLVATAALLLLAAPSSGCYSNRFKRIEGSVSSLSQRADSLAMEHDRTRAEVAEVRAQLEEQNRSLRAGTETSALEMATRLEQLEARLEEQNQMLLDLSGRARTRAMGLDSTATLTTPGQAPASGEAAKPDATQAAGRGGEGAASGATGAAAAAGAAGVAAGVRVDPTAAYDQAVVDFTQGRFPLALEEFRGFLSKWPASDLADNARYGVGESHYAQGQYDSAAVEYRRVVDEYPKGDKVPAALYKLGVTYQRMQRDAEARTTYRTLIEQHPRSGEAKLAEERLRELDGN